MVTVFLKPLEILLHAADGDGHIVALLSVLHQMVVHEDGQGILFGNGQMQQIFFIEIGAGGRDAEDCRRQDAQSNGPKTQRFHGEAPFAVTEV